MRKEVYIQANQAQQPTKIPVRFAEAIPAGESRTLTYKVPADCTLENVYIKFYGSQHMLQVQVLHEMRGTNIANSVIAYMGDREYLSGDFEDYDEPVTRAIRYKDYLIVKANNTGSQENTLNVILSLDTYGGQARVIGG